MLGALASLLALGPSVMQGAGADRHVWKRYTNVRFAFSVCYPGDLLGGA